MEGLAVLVVTDRGTGGRMRKLGRQDCDRAVERDQHGYIRRHPRHRGTDAVTWLESQPRSELAGALAVLDRREESGRRGRNLDAT